MKPEHELGSILARWHHWRMGYSHERRTSRAALFRSSAAMDDDDFEGLLMRAVEDEIDAMPADMQRALQHVARAHCLGVEVIGSALTMDREKREAMCVEAVSTLRRRLTRAGLL